MHYMMVVRIPAYRVSDDQVALESAFAEHIILLREHLKPVFSHFSIVLSGMSQTEYQAQKEALKVISERDTGIRVRIARSVKCSSAKYIVFHLVPNFIDIFRWTKDADLVHAGRDFPTSLFNFLGTISAKLRRRHCVFVVDIDNRTSGMMLYTTGLWAKRTFLLDKYIYTPLVNAQIRFASKHADLLLVKGEALARDFSGRHAMVKRFVDVVHNSDQLIDRPSLDLKLATLDDHDRRLRAVFFGRLVTYKGLDHSIRAIAAAREAGCDVEFTIIGNGPERDKLRALVERLRLEDLVTFHGSVTYKQVLMLIREFDVLLATPLSNDTPRNLFDAMSQGLATVAYATPYYEDFVETDSVIVTPWNDPDHLGQKLAHLSTSREKVREMSECAVRYASENTHDIWLKRRIVWTLDATHLGKYED
jgi:glycosyltransferase involved in cell wall biosynthesis